MKSGRGGGGDDSDGCSHHYFRTALGDSLSSHLLANIASSYSSVSAQSSATASPTPSPTIVRSLASCDHLAPAGPLYRVAAQPIPAAGGTYLDRYKEAHRVRVQIGVRFQRRGFRSPIRARSQESESKGGSDLLWTQESESKGESDLLWTQESESKEEPDLLWTRESESKEESDLAGHLLSLDL
jgi:hypothetical protein